MKYLWFAVYVFVYLACFVDLGQSAINCYQCNSFMDKECADDFGDHPDLLKPCPTNYTMCRKIKQEVKYIMDDGKEDWNIRYIRECAMAGEASDDCRDRTGTYKVKVRYCQCGEPGCNGAGNIKMNLVAAIVPLFVVLLTAFKKL